MQKAINYGYGGYEDNSYFAYAASIKKSKENAKKKVMLLQKVTALFLIVLSLVALILTKELGFIVTCLIGVALLVEKGIVIRF